MSFLTLLFARTRLVLRRNKGASRRVLWRISIAFRQWISPHDNPFLVRAMRAESRRLQPWLTVAIAIALATITNGGAWWMWHFATRDQRFVAAQNNRRGSSLLHFSESLGGNYVGALAIFTALALASWTIFAVRSRASSLLRSETLGGTLDGLQMLPLREERWLWMMSLQPLVVALCIWCVGLPIYALAIWMGVWPARDVVGLLLVWLWIGHVAPLWQPVTWKQSGKTPPRADAATLRAALQMQKEANARGLSLAQALELQRRAQRLLLSNEKTLAEPKPAASALSSTDNRVLDASNLPAKSADAGTNISVSAGASDAVRRDGRGGWNVFGAAFFVFWVFNVLFPFGGFSSGAIGVFYADLLAAVPPEVPPLLRAIPLTWPVVLAKVWLAPLPFFSFVLPPIFVLAPLWIGFSYARNVQLASLVSSSETFWTQRRARRKTAISRAMWLCVLIAVVGYLWRTLIIKGELAPALWSRVFPFADSGAAVALWWNLVFIVGALLAARALETPFAQAAREEIAALQSHLQRRAQIQNDETLRVESSNEDRVLDVAVNETQFVTPQIEISAQLNAETALWQKRHFASLRDAWRASGRQVARVFGWAVLLGLICCWLGGVSGWSDVLQARLWPMFATVAVFLWACWNAAALNSALPFESRPWWLWIRGLWFFAPPIEIAARALWNTSRGHVFGFEQAPHVVISPLVTLFSLLRAQLDADANALLLTGVLAQFTIATLCFLIARRFLRQGQIAQNDDTHLDNAHLDGAPALRDRVLDVLLWPARAIWSGVFAFAQWLTHASSAFNDWQKSVNTRIIARGVALDNAVLTGELRRRVRKVNWCRHWLVGAVLALTVFVFFGIVPLLKELQWNSTFTGWHDALTRFKWSDWGTGLTIVALSMAAVIAVLVVSDLGQSFDADRANGTLVFLFLTPMRDAEILRGKLLASLIYALPLVGITAPYLVFGATVAALGGAWKVCLVALGGAVLVCTVLLFSCGLQLFFGVYSTKPGAGSGKAIMAFTCIEIALWWFNAWLQSVFSTWARVNETWTWLAFFAVLCLVHLWVALLCWHLALRSLQALRLGTAGKRGKVAG